MKKGMACEAALLLRVAGTAKTVCMTVGENNKKAP